MLLTAHDLHEAPWGLGQQLDRLIARRHRRRRGAVAGAAVRLLPAVGRGAMTWKATIRRAEPPVHEVMRPAARPT